MYVTNVLPKRRDGITLTVVFVECTHLPHMPTDVAQLLYFDEVIGSEILSRLSAIV